MATAGESMKAASGTAGSRGWCRIAIWCVAACAATYAAADEVTHVARGSTWKFFRPVTGATLPPATAWHSARFGISMPNELGCPSRRNHANLVAFDPMESA